MGGGVTYVDRLNGLCTADVCMRRYMYTLYSRSHGPHSVPSCHCCPRGRKESHGHHTWGRVCRSNAMSRYRMLLVKRSWYSSVESWPRGAAGLGCLPPSPHRVDLRPPASGLGPEFFSRVEDGLRRGGVVPGRALPPGGVGPGGHPSRGSIIFFFRCKVPINIFGLQN